MSNATQTVSLTEAAYESDLETAQIAHLSTLPRPLTEANDRVLTRLLALSEVPA